MPKQGPETDGEVLKIHEQAGVAWVTLARPDRLNAMSRPLIQGLKNYFTELYDRRDIRVVVLAGEGRAFCAGLDLKEQSQTPISASVGGALDEQRAVRDIMVAMRRCPQPIISIVQGAASGGGFALALASDIRLLTPDARLNAAFIRLGLSGCDVGVSYFLPRMVGSSVAAEYLLTGRFMSAERAFALGLASWVGELKELHAEARSLVTDMLRATPLGLRLTKEALGLAIDLPSLDAVIALEDRNQILCVRDADFSEGVAAFLEKREPRYSSSTEENQ
jgi:enoyl-CoA hydratase